MQAIIEQIEDHKNYMELRVHNLNKDLERNDLTPYDRVYFCGIITGYENSISSLKYILDGYSRLVARSA